MEKNYVTINHSLLAELFRECNNEFFGNELPNVMLNVRNGRNTLGSCSVRRGVASINISQYYKVERDDVKNVMIHEMIHLWEWVNYKTMSHTHTFKLKAREVERISNGKFTISRLTSRKNYEVAKPKNNIYAVFICRENNRAWIVACTEFMATQYRKGFTKSVWGLDLVGFVRDMTIPEFDGLPKMKDSIKIRGKVMDWDKLNEKYSEFANSITT